MRNHNQCNFKNCKYVQLKSVKNELLVMNFCFCEMLFIISKFFNIVFFQKMIKFDNETVLNKIGEFRTFYFLFCQCSFHKYCLFVNIQKSVPLTEIFSFVFGKVLGFDTDYSAKIGNKKKIMRFLIVFHKPKHFFTKSVAKVLYKRKSKCFIVFTSTN